MKEETEYCYRCSKKSITPLYQATTTKELNDYGINKVGNEPDDADGNNLQIRTCIGCTSPSTRKRLHKQNAYKRYEHAFLNAILLSIKDSNTIKSIDANLGNKDLTAYDLLLTDVNGVNPATTVLLVEIDEGQHFTSPGWVDGKLREDVFFRRYNYAKCFILRIRVGEDGMQDSGEKIAGSKCVVKNGKSICIVNNSQFDTNIAYVRDYIKKVFSKNKPNIQEAYINFSDTNGVRDGNEVVVKVKPGSEKEMQKVIETWDTRIQRPIVKENYTDYTSKKKMEKLINDVSKIEIAKKKPKKK